MAVITAYGSAENAVAALKAGAFDYVSKPVGLEQLRALVKSALSLPDNAGPSGNGARQLLGESAPLVHVRNLIAKLARTQAPVYISGESGSGKELAARLIHENGARRDKPFVPVNCGAIPETLVESELFGYRKGAFTGATEDRDGFFQAAHGGTLFLDEIAELPLHTQVLLLRAIQERARAQGRFDPGGTGRRAHHLCDPTRTWPGWWRRALSPRPLLPSERGGSHHAAAARMPRGHPAHRRAHPAASRRAERARSAPALGERAEGADGVADSATCASWRTSSSARSRFLPEELGPRR